LITYRLHATNTSRTSLRCFDEVRLVYRKLEQWLDGPVPNSLAPIHWPGYLRFFAGICEGAVFEEPLAALLPRGFLQGNLPLRPEETEALRRLTGACKEFAGTDEATSVPVSELLQRCERAWARR
jgi:hypothetical protein